MPALSSETLSKALPLPNSGAKIQRKSISELAPCYPPIGIATDFAEGSIYKTTTESVNFLQVYKTSPDGQRVTASNQVIVMREPSGDEIWVVPAQQGREDRSRRFRLMENGNLEILLVNGVELRLEYDFLTGHKKVQEGPSNYQPAPNYLQEKALAEVITTMAALVQDSPLEINTLQTFVNFPRDQKLEDF